MPQANSTQRRKRRNRRARRRRERVTQGEGEARRRRPPISERVSKEERSIGSQIGSTIGNFAERGLRSLFGSGDYAETFEDQGGFDVDENSIVKPLTSSAVPLLNSADLKDGHIRIKHREFISDISTAQDDNANIVTLPINPQESNMFPWLSTIAGNFEQWIPHGIVFEYVSTCGNAVSSTNAALGSVSMATQYNVYSDAFLTKSTLLNHYYAASTKTSENLMHAIECDPEEVQLPIFNTFDGGVTPAVDGDLRMYYLGATTILLTGSQDVYTAGEVWVTYDISLIKPRINLSAALEDRSPLSLILRQSAEKIMNKMSECKTPEGMDQEDHSYDDCQSDTSVRTSSKFLDHQVGTHLRTSAIKNYMR
jgi:hypothetical protein